MEIIHKIVNDYYFNAITFTWMKKPQERSYVRKILEISYMMVARGCLTKIISSGLNFNDLNEDSRQKTVKSLKEGIYETYKLGAKGFTLLSIKLKKLHEKNLFKISKLKM